MQDAMKPESALVLFRGSGENRSAMRAGVSLLTEYLGFVPSGSQSVLL